MPHSQGSGSPLWYGIAVLPCFSASGKFPVTRCGLPLRGTYAAYVQFPLRLSHAHARLRPRKHFKRFHQSQQGGRIPHAQFSAGIVILCEAFCLLSHHPEATRPLVQMVRICTSHSATTIGACYLLVSKSVARSQTARCFVQRLPIPPHLRMSPLGHIVERCGESCHVVRPQHGTHR